MGGDAYGSGSSREVAVVAHQGAGIELVVAKSFQRFSMVYGGMPFTTDFGVVDVSEEEVDESYIALFHRSSLKLRMRVDYWNMARPGSLGWSPGMPETPKPTVELRGENHCVPLGWGASDATKAFSLALMKYIPEIRSFVEPHFVVHEYLPECALFMKKRLERWPCTIRVSRCRRSLRSH